MRVLQGNCFEQDRVLPYASTFDLLQSYIASETTEEIAEAFGPDISDLVKLAPELHTKIPGIVPTPTLDPEQDKRKIFNALTSVASRLASKSPVLMIIEDLHWADGLSLEFLQYLARRIESQSILLLATYRDDEVNESLAHFLSELDRQRLCSELALKRLTMSEAGVMVSATLDLRRPLRMDFLQNIYELTDGNPFFVEEVLTSIVPTDTEANGRQWETAQTDDLKIPRSVHDSVRRRKRTVSPAAQRVLSVAAVSGRRFNFELLRELTDLDNPELLEALRELIQSQLVVEESADVFIFRHALTQQAIYSELLGRERRAAGGPGASFLPR